MLKAQNVIIHAFLKAGKTENEIAEQVFLLSDWYLEDYKVNFYETVQIHFGTQDSS